MVPPRPGHRAGRPRRCADARVGRAAPGQRPRRRELATGRRRDQRPDRGGRSGGQLAGRDGPFPFPRTSFDARQDRHAFGNRGGASRDARLLRAHVGAVRDVGVDPRLPHGHPPLGRGMRQAAPKTVIVKRSPACARRTSSLALGPEHLQRDRPGLHRGAAHDPQHPQRLDLASLDLGVLVRRMIDVGEEVGPPMDQACRWKLPTMATGVRPAASADDHCAERSGGRTLALAFQ